MTLKQIEAALKIIEKERRKEAKDQLALLWMAVHADGEVIKKMLR